MEGIGSVSAVSAALNVTIRISQAIYELKAVDQQARDLLETTGHVEHNLGPVKTLRRQKSMHMSHTEMIWIDGVITNAENTVQNVAALIEPARVDMQTKFGKVGFRNKVAFVLRDSPRVVTNLSRLSIANQSLNTAMGILSNRGGIHQVIDGPGSPYAGGSPRNQGTESDKHNHGSLTDSIVSSNVDNKPPPSYDDTINDTAVKELTISNAFKHLPIPQDDIAELDSLSVSREAELFPEVVSNADGQFLPENLPGNLPFFLEEKQVCVDNRPIFLSPEEYSEDAPMESGTFIAKPSNIGYSDGLQVAIPDHPEVEAVPQEPNFNGRFSDTFTYSGWQIPSPPQLSNQPMFPDGSEGHKSLGMTTSFISLPPTHIAINPESNNYLPSRPNSISHPPSIVSSRPQSLSSQSHRDSLASIVSLLPIATQSQPQSNSRPHPYSKSQSVPLPSLPTMRRKEIYRTPSTASLQTIGGASTISDLSTSLSLTSATAESVSTQSSPDTTMRNKPMTGKDRREAWLEFQASRR
jgi:hypothetical protein